MEKKHWISVLGALGVVYGDIGTSPLYTFATVVHAVPILEPSILGVLSMIVWSLISVISIKYIGYVLKADNHGEGGILALLALVRNRSGSYATALLVLAAFGASLILADGVLTPAISVLSAMEGLQMIIPLAPRLVIVMATVLILFCLFWIQPYGTQHIGFWFGPILLVWFLTLGFLGGIQVYHYPSILKAIHPYWAFQWFIDYPKHALSVLGIVFLVMTGGEALYADLGHFGRKAIAWGWFGLVLPCLLLNYFGQGALLLVNPDAAVNPFYSLVPTYWTGPLLVLSTLAAIIASQAVITALFSLTRQAVLLDLSPHTRIIQTSAEHVGQVYVPLVNRIIACITVLIVLVVKRSSELAHMYGIAVNMLMVLTTILLAYLARKVWQWSLLRMALFFGFFLLLENSFLIANLIKLEHGGFLPLILAMGLTGVMWTWYKGSQWLKAQLDSEQLPLTELVQHLKRSDSFQRIPRLTGVFVTDSAETSSGSLLHYLKLNRAVPEYILLVKVIILDIPTVRDKDQIDHIQSLGDKIYRLNLYFGFMQKTSVPEALDKIKKFHKLPLVLDTNQVTFFVEMAHVVTCDRKQTGMYRWQKRLFAYLKRSASKPETVYHLPLNRTIAIGSYYEI